MRVSVFAPATTANLGPGYDVLGAALGFGLRLDASDETGSASWSVGGDGVGGVEPPGPDLVLEASRLVAGTLPPLALSMQTDIPVARGLGSSSAAIVAGLLVGCAVSGRNPDRAELLRAAVALEGHPDNLAPCLFGGLVVCVPGAGSSAMATQLFEPTDRVRPVVLVPPTTLSTGGARAVVPDRIAHADAAFTSARVAVLVSILAGTTDPDPGLLLRMTDDVLHQPYRAGLMPESAELIQRLRDAGVAAMVSGAGPSVLCLLAPGQSVPPVPEGWRLRDPGWGGGATVGGTG